jgi:RNA polymerase sigma-70 factor (ECF subfamily)
MSMLASDAAPLASVEEDPEANLVRRAKERWPSTWAEIYDAYYKKLYRYCYARCGSEATAADLASKVYLEALEGIDKYEYRGKPLLAWFYRIAHNVVVDHLRAKEREGRAFERVASFQAPHSADPADDVDSQHDVRAAMRELTEEQQQVIELRYYGGLTTAEIAVAMDKTERAVYSLEVRALGGLRRALRPEVRNAA